mmetsp:Transcript_74462/g.147997  ORF Transcript_74462/g.147997 Transcript_74462/m.147997 type:complete len:124 (+) Transcript_74462:20-391(+)
MKHVSAVQSFYTGPSMGGDLPAVPNAAVDHIPCGVEVWREPWCTTLYRLSAGAKRPQVCVPISHQHSATSPEAFGYVSGQDPQDQTLIFLTPEPFDAPHGFAIALISFRSTCRLDWTDRVSSC